MGAANVVWVGYATADPCGEWRLAAEGPTYETVVARLRAQGWPGPFLIVRRGAVRGGVGTGQPGVVRGRRKAEGKEG
jgi:hypothetical protein